MTTESIKTFADASCGSDEIVCHCYGKTRSELCVEIERLGLKTFDEVVRCLLAGAGCSLRRSDVDALLDAIGGAAHRLEL